jgi:1-acyl-sn-glycerol-3-phosphate acyltransferase
VEGGGVVGLLRSIWANFALVVLVILFGPPVILLAPVRGGELSIALGKIGARLHLLASGVRISVEGMEHVPAGRPCVFVANHQGTYDAHAMMLNVPPPVRVLAKKELFSVPMFGWALTVLGFPKVDRGDSAKAQEQMDLAVASVKRRRISIFGFPEGTRNIGLGLLPFKKGLFVLAIQLGMPVVPVAIGGSRRIQGRKTFRVNPGQIRVTFLETEPTEGLTYEDRDRLIAKVRDRIEAGLAPEDRG